MTNHRKATMKMLRIDPIMLFHKVLSFNLYAHIQLKYRRVLNDMFTVRGTIACEYRFFVLFVKNCVWSVNKF